MKRTRDISTIGRGLAVTLALGVFLVGCERAPAPVKEAPAKEAPAASAVQAAVVPRSEDAAYQSQLRGAVADRKRKANSLARVEKQLRELEDRARSALPAGATPEQVRAELEGHPKKYPAYGELLRARAEGQADVKDFSGAQKMIRARVQREVAERAQGAEPAVK
jgi:hypothetical protein